MLGKQDVMLAEYLVPLGTQGGSSGCDDDNDDDEGIHRSWQILTSFNYPVAKKRKPVG